MAKWNINTDSIGQFIWHASRRHASQWYSQLSRFIELLLLDEKRKRDICHSPRTITVWLNLTQPVERPTRQTIKTNPDSTRARSLIQDHLFCKPKRITSKLQSGREFHRTISNINVAASCDNIGNGPICFRHIDNYYPLNYFIISIPFYSGLFFFRFCSISNSEHGFSLFWENLCSIQRNGYNYRFTIKCKWAISFHFFLLFCFDFSSRRISLAFEYHLNGAMRFEKNSLNAIANEILQFFFDKLLLRRANGFSIGLFS